MNISSRGFKLTVSIIVLLVSSGAYIYLGYLVKGQLPTRDWYLVVAGGLPFILFPFIPGAVVARIFKRPLWGIVLSALISYVLYLGGSNQGISSLPQFLTQLLASSVLILFLTDRLKLPPVKL